MVGGLDMAYFLGNKQYGKLKPLELIDENGEKIPNKLLDILKFTTSFDTEIDLKEYLSEHFLIENFSANLCYLISKGPKNNRRYEIIRQGDTVYLSDAAKYFDVSYLKKYVDDHKLDGDFLSHLLSFYLKKFGLLSLALKQFNERAYNYAELNNILESLLKADFSQALINHLLKIKELIDCPESVDIHGRVCLTKKEDTYYQSLLDNLYYIISQDDDDVRRFVNVLKGRYRFPAIPAIQILEKINSICHYITTVGANNMEEYDEDDNLHTNCEQFVSLLLYTYNPQTNDYKKVNGRYKVNERNLCDLAMFIANYEEYTDSINIVVRNTYSAPPTTTAFDEEEEEREEFLEESDFRRCGQSSADYGYNLRYGDGNNEW